MKEMTAKKKIETLKVLMCENILISMEAIKEKIKNESDVNEVIRLVNAQTVLSHEFRYLNERR